MQIECLMDWRVGFVCQLCSWCPSFVANHIVSEAVVEVAAVELQNSRIVEPAYPRTGGNEVDDLRVFNSPVGLNRLLKPGKSGFCRFICRLAEGWQGKRSEEAIEK